LIQGRKTTKKETGFYQRVDYLRGLNYNRDEEIASIESSVQNIDDTVIEPLSNGVIGLKNSYGKSLVKALPIANMPNVVNNIHLVEHAQKLPFPIELHWMFHFSKMKGAFSLASKGERASDRIKENQIEAYENGSNQKGSLATARVILDEMTDGVDNRELFVNYLATFVVAGQSMRE
ncbi:conjugal transfer protein, partial [Lactococcus lactis]|nr:conjugal transfer protein [Lactococcus lactis]